MRQTPMPIPKTTEPVSYEAALEELEQLVGRIESGQWPMDQLQACHQRGTALLDFCHRHLQSVQDQIDQNALPKWVH